MGHKILEFIKIILLESKFIFIFLMNFEVILNL